MQSLPTIHDQNHWNRQSFQSVQSSIRNEHNTFLLVQKLSYIGQSIFSGDFNDIGSAFFKTAALPLAQWMGSKELEEAVSTSLETMAFVQNPLSWIAGKTINKGADIFSSTLASQVADQEFKDAIHILSSEAATSLSNCVHRELGKKQKRMREEWDEFSNKKRKLGVEQREEVPLVANQPVVTKEPHTALQADTKINESTFYTLLINAKDVVKINSSTALKCEKNESGFVRINIPMDPSQTPSNITKLRLNFWSPDAGVTTQPETIHNHPNYFESYVIRGGYTHELFASDEKDGSVYDRYIIREEGGVKSREYTGKYRLQSINQESVSPGDIVAFPTPLIHRVESTQERTLTLNAVLPDNDNPKQFSVFVTEGSSSDEVKIRRENLEDDMCQQVREEIVEYIDEFLQNRNANSIINVQDQTPSNKTAQAIQMDKVETIPFSTFVNNLFSHSLVDF